MLVIPVFCGITMQWSLAQLYPQKKGCYVQFPYFLCSCSVILTKLAKIDIQLTSYFRMKVDKKLILIFRGMTILVN